MSKKRSIYNQRDVVLLNEKEIDKRGMSSGDRVDIYTLAADGLEKVVRGFKLAAYNIPDGSCTAYYPETSPLVPLSLYDPLSGTPSAKGV